MENVLLLAIRHYDFEGSNGRRVQGVQLTYITDDVQTEGNTRGSLPMTVSAPMEVLSQVGALPAYYALDFKQRPGPKGKPTLNAVKASFVAPLPGASFPVGANPDEG